MRADRLAAVLQWALALGLVLPQPSLSSDTNEKHAAVRELKPVGYWPLDEAEGTILHDRSGNGNHGENRHIPWENGLLDFTNAYQFAEIPASREYDNDALTLGGWVFSRRDAYDGSGFYLLGNKGELRLQVVGDLGGCVNRCVNEIRRPSSSFSLRSSLPG